TPLARGEGAGGGVARGRVAARGRPGVAGGFRGRRRGAARAAVPPFPCRHRPADPGGRRRPGGGPADRRRPPARVRDGGGDRVRDGGGGGAGVRHVLVVRARIRGEPAAVRLRGGRHRRARFAVGDTSRRDRARRGAGG